MKNRKPAPSFKKDTPKSNQDWIYGLHACKYALSNTKRIIQKVLLTTEIYDTFMAEQLLPDHIPYELRSGLEIAKNLPPQAVHQGIAIQSKALAQPSLEEFLIEHENTENLCVVILDQVTDPHNIGAIMRTASAFGAHAIITTDRGTPPLTGTIAKSASGAVEFLPFIRVTNLARGLDMLKKIGFWVVGLDENGEKFLHEHDLKGKIGLLLGAEGPGLRRLSLESCDYLAKLPTVPPIGCLNVSNAAAIGLYEYKKQNS
ncbi:MAG: 23S rRNA (guanosine(2251)-2'-O)-methyltransferase RlmB [Alphaproteobacteria bacterium]|nr:23S rRNA (guanosine(2251)-2'-O)-methyltransferase RlmB [Alphaproteobacteria bacterium]